MLGPARADTAARMPDHIEVGHRRRDRHRMRPHPPSSLYACSRRIAALAGFALLGAGLAGCGAYQPVNLVNVFRPYRVEIVQGNVVTQERADRIKPGMSRAEVRDILGTPLLTDIFHANRWDYTFLLNRPGTPTQLRSVVVHFESDQVTKIEAPELPTEAEFLNMINTYRPRGSVPVLALTEEQIKALPVPPRPAPAASEPEGPTRSYPPLEQRG